MKFTCTIDIDKPRELVAQLFADPKYLAHYQDGFISKELLKGEAGQKDATSKMLYKQGKGQMELTETIVENNLPETFRAQYHHKHMDNTMYCQFIALSDTQTRYVSEIDYTAFRGVLPRVMVFLFPGFFKKQVQKWLQNFKVFAEEQP